MRYFIKSEEELCQEYKTKDWRIYINWHRDMDYLLGIEIGELEYNILEQEKVTTLGDLGLYDLIPTEGEWTNYNFSLHFSHVIAKDIPDPEFRLEDEDKNTIKKMKEWFDEILYQD